MTWPGRSRSPNHRMPSNSRNEGAKCVRLTWQAACGGPWAMDIELPEKVDVIISEWMAGAAPHRMRSYCTCAHSPHSPAWPDTASPCQLNCQPS